MAQSIAYIMSRFPHLPETFILREMLEMQKLGWKVEVFPLIKQKQEVIHPQVELLAEHIHNHQLVSWGVIASTLRLLYQKPRLFFNLLSTIIRENWTNGKFLSRSLVIFPISIHLAEKMQAAGIQRIHAHYATHPALAAWIVHQITGLPYTITVHAHDIFVDKPMLCTKLDGAELIIAISKYNYDYLKKLCPISITQKIHVIHCGIEPDKYSPRNEDTHNSIFHILHIGSLQPYKGQKYLIQACKFLKESGVNFLCELIGGGELENQLSLQIKELGLDDMVHLLGPLTQDQIATRLPQADCYVQPSIITESGKMEGIPVGIMEAMASRVAVVATSISGIPEIILDGQTGFLVPPEDPKAIAKAIQLVYNDKNHNAKVAHNAYQLVTEEFNLHKNVSKFSEILFSRTMGSD